MQKQEQQTAVEWFVDQLEKHYVFQDIKNTTAFLQAKEMEKEQMIKAHISAGARLEDISIEAAEQYYNETYGEK
jgi:hypothetical protein